MLSAGGWEGQNVNKSEEIRKISEFMRHKIEEQCDLTASPDDPNQVKKSYIEFDFEEMVENGMYKDAYTAEAVFEKVFPLVRAGEYVDVREVVDGDDKYALHGGILEGYTCEIGTGHIRVYVCRRPDFWRILDVLEGGGADEKKGA